MDTVSFVKTDEISNKIEVLFEVEKEKISHLFPAAKIEHISGTSVSGSISKGDLDINVRVKPEDFEKITEILRGLYKINQLDNWTNGFRSFKDDSHNLGIQLTVISSADDHFVVQRDYLRSHPKEVLKLNALKEKVWMNTEEKKGSSLRISILNYKSLKIFFSIPFSLVSNQ